MTGLARDLLTDRHGIASVQALDRLVILAAPDGLVLSIETNRSRRAAQQLIGHRGGGSLRAAIAEHLPNELASSTPLHLLLDDYTGAQLVSNVGWMPWDPIWMETREAAGVPITAGRHGRMDNVCIGFAPGASGLRKIGRAHV